MSAPLPQGNELLREIERLRKELDAVVLAHYYQDPDIQDLADFVGDSLQLSQQAARTKAKIIAFCGVHFMAETAKILNPDKQVLLPDLDAGCSLADRCPADQFGKWLEQYPDHKVISYINCSAGVKALSDVICTSSNAEKIVNSFPRSQKIVFAPDRHLGAWVEKTRPDAELIPAPPSSGCNCSICPYMRLNSLEKLYLCLRDRKPEITLSEDLRLRALRPVQRMLELSA